MNYKWLYKQSANNHTVYAVVDIEKKLAFIGAAPYGAFWDFEFLESGLKYEQLSVNDFVNNIMYNGDLIQLIERNCLSEYFAEAITSLINELYTVKAKLNDNYRKYFNSLCDKNFGDIIPPKSFIDCETADLRVRLKTAVDNLPNSVLNSNDFDIIFEALKAIIK